LVEANEAGMYYNLELQQDIQGLTGVDGVIVAVVHKPYREIGLPKIAGLCTNGGAACNGFKGRLQSIHLSIFI
jgi:UDP-N-acetyl-D-galactosamine dehydrogenase